MLSNNFHDITLTYHVDRERDKAFYLCVDNITTVIGGMATHLIAPKEPDEFFPLAYGVGIFQ